MKCSKSYIENSILLGTVHTVSMKFQAHKFTTADLIAAMRFVNVLCKLKLATSDEVELFAFAVFDRKQEDMAVRRRR